MAEAVTTTFTGIQKAAIVIMNMEPERAALVLQQLTETEAEDITAEIIRLRTIPAEARAAAIDEFHDIAVVGKFTAHGGRDYAEGLLERTFGAERAAGVLNRISSSLAGKAFEFLEDAEPSQILTLLDGEMPQTIALVLTHLRSSHASVVLAGLGDEVRTDVAHCIASMGRPNPEAVAAVAQTLKGRAVAVVAPRSSLDVIGGVQPLVDIINRSDVATERALLAGLEQRDPELAEEVRSRMLTFDDIVRLDARDVQQVLRGIDSSVLATAVKGAPEAVFATITENLSERNRELLHDELDSLGPVRVSQVEEARAAVVRAIRELVESGGIVIHRNEEDALVE